MPINRTFCSLWCCFVLNGCVFGHKSTEVPVTPGRSKAAAPAIEIPTSAIQKPEPERESADELRAATTDTSSTGGDPCHVLRVQGRPPFFLKDKGFLVTNIVKPCVTRDGHRGFERGSPWMAMGIPCTGGSGRVRVDGKTYAPAMIHFDLATNCPMLPGPPELVRQHAVEALGLGSNDQLLAFTPLAVQYWEFVDFPDAGTGTDLRLWTAVGLKDAWGQFQKREPLTVRLYGRENAWVSQAIVYVVEGQVSPLSATQFTLRVQDVRPATPDEMAAAAQRCGLIRPPLNCGRIF